MSFGFSVGDLIAGASIAYKLYQTLSEYQGASKEYQSLTAKLLIVHKILLQSTLNGILFLTNGMNGAISECTTRLEQYRESLRVSGSANALKDIYMKSKWALQMSEKLSGTLNSNPLSLSILIQMACYFNPGFETVQLKGSEVVYWTRLPLKWIPLDSIPNQLDRENERAIRQTENIEAIQGPPLTAMFQHGTILVDGQVRCDLLRFRVDHREHCRKLGEESSASMRQTYISSDEVGTNRPILSQLEVDELVREKNWGFHPLEFASHHDAPWVGAIMIRRRGVVRQGTESCLCLGIHTCGASDQPDQELSAILHSSKHAPAPLPKETEIRLRPIRLKAEHPSTALPSTDRIHFGRVYKIQHQVMLKSIGSFTKILHGLLTKANNSKRETESRRTRDKN
ncbi:hypothetical protein BDW60DRAFT_219485 [Aspergillus nidulans var. acristatus]